MAEQLEQIQAIINNSHKIVVIQADNPDADSLGSALALEHILGDMGKTVYLYSGVDMPGYLRYLVGWDRVSPELPDQFDASIIVDASTMTLLERMVKSGYQGALSTKPCIVLDHHETVDNMVPFATVMINDPLKSSAGELIYSVCQELGWKSSIEAQAFLMTSILGDTQGLSNQLAGAETYRVMAEFIESGVNRPKLEELRREYSKMPATIYKYKADLIKRTVFDSKGRIATVTIPQNEINEFSPLYNPGPLIQPDMLQTEGVQVAIVFKHYTDGKVTGAIRCNTGSPIGGKLAEYLGGGGHDYASGFKITDGRSIHKIKQVAIMKAEELLDAAL